MADVLGSQHRHAFGTNQLKLFVFRVGQTLYGINLAKIRESLVYLPEARSNLAFAASPASGGLLDVRGESVPVIDVSAYLDGTSLLSRTDSMAIVAEYDGGKVAMLVNEVLFNLNVDWHDVASPGHISAYGAAVTGFVLSDEHGIIQLLDFETMRHDVLGPPLQIEMPDNPLTTDAPVVLYAEDSLRVRATLKAQLEECGFQVIAVENGKQAWRVLQEPGTHLDAVVSDIEMPLMDGTRLLRLVRTQSSQKALPFILCSSMTNESNVAQYLQLGATAFVGKQQITELPGQLLSAIEAKSSGEDPPQGLGPK